MASRRAQPQTVGVKAPFPGLIEPVLAEQRPARRALSEQHRYRSADCCCADCSGARNGFVSPPDYFALRPLFIFESFRVAPGLAALGLLPAP